MRRKKLLRSALSILMMTCFLGTTVVNAEEFGQGTQTNYSHGSETTVSESELKTEVPSDYDVNTETQAKAKTGAYAKLFDTENLQEVNITIDENNWNYALQNAIDKPYVLADQISIGEESVSYVGIKPKGNLTLSQVWQSDSDRFSFTVNVSKYIKKKNGYSATQNFYGLEKFSLNNIYGDASYMKEYLSYELMSEMGIATPYYCLVKLTVNGEYWGVYCMVENVDESLIKRTVDSSADGDLYKNEAPGGDLIYNTSLDTYLSGENAYDFSTYGESDNVLSNYSGIFDNKEIGTTIEDYLTDLAAATTDEEKAAVESEYNETLTSDCNELFTWMKELNVLNETEDANTDAYKESLENILDVDQALRYFAVNTYLVNLDSYQSEKEQNYCIYLLDGKATIIPWDYNYSFGGYGVDDASSMINFNVDTPVIDVTLAERPLLNVLLQNDEYRSIYESYLNDCATIATNGGTVTGTNYSGEIFTSTYDANNFASQLTDYKENILPAALSETSVETPFYTYDQFQTAVDNLILLINQRSVAVVNQINDIFDTVDTNGANLNAIGNVTGSAGSGGPEGGDGQTPPDGMIPDGTIPSGEPTMPDGTTPSGAPTPPDGTMPSDQPAASEVPEATASPEVTQLPAETEMPVATETPEVTASPVTTETPEATATPVATETPEVTETPETTAKPTTAPVTVSKIKLNKTSATLKVGGTVTLKATVTPVNAANTAVAYTSSDTSVATVNSKGVVTAKSQGTAVITCKAKDGSGTYTTCKITVSKLAKVTNLKTTKATTSKITLSWKKISGATGYKVYQYNSKKKAYVLVATTTKNSATIKDLSAGTTCKFKVRAYTTVNNKTKYGSYSSVLKTSTMLKKPTVTVKKRTNTTATLSFSKVTNATGYEIFRSTSKSGTYKKVATVTKSGTYTYKQTGLKKNKTYYYKVRAYKIVNGKKVYSSYSKVEKASK